VSKQFVGSSVKCKESRERISGLGDGEVDKF